MYLHADLTLKERAIERTAPLKAKRRRYRPSDKLLDFLESLWLWDTRDQETHLSQGESGGSLHNPAVYIVHPATLLFGSREDLPESGPEAERPVTHGQYRRP